MSILELKVPPVVQLLLLFVLMWFLSISIPVFSFVIPANWQLSLTFTCLGLALSISGVITFRLASTTVDPRCPEEVSTIVKSGVYKWSRNPMYLGFLSILLGWALYLANVSAFICLPLFVLYMNRFQIQPEEKAMSTRFGDEYLLYMNSVRRWI
ncbi:MAG: isoprenylcysteine carboxylmethyltransferase family protein [Gammaproteobacteria bacterium]|nr:isoprenylcysteine carboxylmethyltransferase family protein [Gammaproteobacteria bacterium]